MTAIDLSTSKDIPRVLRNAILDDVSPLPRGSRVIYWRGETDTMPRGDRKAAFDAAYKLYENKRVILCQQIADTMTREKYEYIAVVL
jgi:hypothetical protein